MQRLVGSALLAQGMGLSMAAAGVSAIFGPSLGGLAYDVFGSYTVAFVVSGVLMMIGSFLFFLGDFRTPPAPSPRNSVLQNPAFPEANENTPLIRST